MTRNASVVRDDGGLRTLSQDLEAATSRKLNSRRDFEDVALTTVAGAVMSAALARTETRGCHHRADYPHTDPAMARSLTPAVACA
jgi:L-aspartate oxidase